MMLSPKEKAIELVDKFENYSFMDTDARISSFQSAKQCALIALKEMQEVYASVASAIPQLNETKKYRSTYLDEVKEEIEKL